MKSSKVAASAATPRATDVVAVVAAASDTSTDRMLTRSEVAEILGISSSSVRRLEKKNVLAAVVDENETHRHSEKRVLAYKLQRASSAGDRSVDDGTLASAAFERFDRGASPVDVVKELKIAPRVARDLLVEWADLGAGFVVSGAAAAKIGWLAWGCQEIEVTSGEDIVAVLERFEKPQCCSCGRGTPRLCLRCYTNRPQHAQKVVAAATAASEASRQELVRRDLEKEVVERASRRGAGIVEPDLSDEDP